MADQAGLEAGPQMRSEVKNLHLPEDFFEGNCPEVLDYNEKDTDQKLSLTNGQNDLRFNKNHIFKERGL